MSEQIDERLVNAADSAGIAYKVKEGRLMTVVDLDEGRSQIVFVESNTHQFADVEMRCVKAVAYKGKYPKPNILVHCLEKNAGYKIGAWEAHFDREEKHCALVFSADIGAGLDGKRLQAVINAVGMAADDLEKKLSQGDEL